MSSIDKLIKAKDLFYLNLNILISFSKINIDLERLEIETRDGLKIFVQYNAFKEYSYSIFFSSLKNDFCRYDNYDDLWSVKTRPHHFHLRWKKGVSDSPMKGDPESDIPVLCKWIKLGKF
jgi:hypothetical protein